MYDVLSDCEGGERHLPFAGRILSRSLNLVCTLEGRQVHSSSSRHADKGCMNDTTQTNLTFFRGP